MGVFGYWYYGVSQVKAPEVVETPRVFTKETDAVTINITYPTIPGATEGVARANLALQTALDKRIAEFEKEADISMRVDTGFPKDIKSSVTGSPAVEEKNNRYVALVRLYGEKDFIFRGREENSNVVTSFPKGCRRGC
jgi:hypothetical protein